MVDSTKFFAVANSAVVPATIRLASDGRAATLVYNSPLPASTAVRVTFIGDGTLDNLFRTIDADGDGLAGGTAIIQFQTLPLARITGTNVFGYVYDSYNLDPNRRE